MTKCAAGRMAILAAACAGVLSLTSAPASAQACDRACLKGYMDQYLDALVRHEASKLPVAAGATIIYNGKPAKLDSEIWKVVDNIHFRQYVMDPTTEEVALFGVAVQDYKRGTLFVRLAVKGGKLTVIEQVAGERTQDGVPGLISPNPFYDYVLPPNQRRSRKELIRIADSYFEGLEKHTGKAVPISADCRRFEDGVQTTLNPVFLPLSCNDFGPFGYMDATANRLYPIVDVARGLVLGQMVIQVSQAAGPPTAPVGAAASRAPQRPARPPVNPISGMIMPGNEFRGKPHDTIIHELFKIVDGKITEIQTIRLDRPYGWGGGW